jgi:transient receptor potential cation channel subfamily M protein 2
LCENTFSSTYNQLEEHSNQIWKYERYELVFEYKDTPLLPPPLTVIGYIYGFVKYLIAKCRTQNTQNVNEASHIKDELSDSIYFKKFNLVLFLLLIFMIITSY